MRYVGNHGGLVRQRFAAAAASLVGLTGCVAYHAKPLDSAAPPPDGASRLYVDASTLPSPRLREHRFDRADGLDETEVAMLAVANNPDLRLLRDDLGIQRAQAFAAGLLPDPQLSFGQDFVVHSAPGLVTGSIADITFDVTALLTHPDVARASRHEIHSIELDELWAEWQTVAQARLLFAQTRADEALLAELEPLLPGQERLRQSIDSAVRAGNLTALTAAGALQSVADLRRQVIETSRRLNQDRHNLRLLLGLSERAELHLVDDETAAEIETPGDADTETRLAELPQRRPDLLALRAGYDAEEARVREAVLKQFPAISLGFNRATDTSNITSRGYNISLSLPLFNRARGDIAVETATRQKLYDEYQARLASTRSDVDRIRADLPALARQADDAAHDAERLRQSQHAAEAAFATGALDWNTYLTLTTSAAGKQLESVQLALTLNEQKAALQTLLGTELPEPMAKSP
jgi:outer membrane protein TolC